MNSSQQPSRRNILKSAAAGAIAAAAAAPLIMTSKTKAETKGRIYGTGGAAELLGLKPSTLQSRMKKLGIARQDQFIIEGPT